MPALGDERCARCSCLNCTFLDFFFLTLLRGGGGCYKFRRSVFPQLYTLLHNVAACCHVLSVEGHILAAAAPRYDFSPDCPGNGMRSLLAIAELAGKRTEGIVTGIQRDCGKVIFRADKAYEQLCSFAGILRTLTRLMTLAAQLSEDTPDGSLFVQLTPARLAVYLAEVEGMSRTDFYGPCFGFHYPSASQRILSFIGVAMAGYSHGHERSSTLARGAVSVLHSSLYFLRPAAKAKRIVETHQTGSIPFAKAFWNLLDTTSARHLAKVYGVGFNDGPCWFLVPLCDRSTRS